MSLRTFQQAQLAMIMDGDVARRVSEGDLRPWEEELTSCERERLVSQATDAGVALSRKLHKGWRLTKLLTLLPATFREGDPDLLGDWVDTFWRRHPPQGLYFEAEAARFAAFVADRAPERTSLHDAAVLEGALLGVGHLGPRGDVIEVHSTHDPRQLLSNASSSGAPEVRGFDVSVTAGPAGPELSIRRCDGRCPATTGRSPAPARGT